MTTENAQEKTTESFENPQTMETSDIAEVLHFDPFKGKSEKEVPEVKATAATSEPTDKAAATPGNEQSANTPPSAKKTDESVQPGNEVDQAAAWRAIAEAATAVKATKSEDKKVEETPDPRKLPEYHFDIPDVLLSKITSQDPAEFKIGLQAYARGIANVVHSQVFKHIEEFYKPQLASIPQNLFAQIEAQRAAEETKKDFYGRYPEFNNPVLMPVIRQIGEQIAKEKDIKRYTPELGDAIAAKAREIFGTLKQPQQTKPAPKAPKMLPTQGSRQAPEVLDDEAKEVADLLFGNDF